MRLNQIFTRQARPLWIALLALSPLAYFGSVVLTRLYDPSTNVGFELGRREAIDAAADYARSLGLNVGGWTAGVQPEVSNDRYFYYRLRDSADVARSRRVAPEAALRAMFVSADDKEKLQVTLGTDGRPLGFVRTLSPNQEIPDPGEAASRQLAERAARAFMQADADLALDAPELREERKFNRVTRRYTWRQKFPTLPELVLGTTVSVTGDQITAHEVSTKFDEAYADTHFVNRQIAAKIAMIPFALFVIFMAAYGLYRYIQRTRQKEVPHARSLLVCLVMTGAFLLMSLQTDFLIFNPGPGSGHVAIKLIMLLVTGSFFLVMGAFLGMAYGSGEGDVREDYPGKLTSLDALLTGRIFSRNAGRAICVGTALGGWTMLARALSVVPWSLTPGDGQGLTERGFSILFGQMNWAAPLLMPFFAVVTVVLGLLLPLSFLHHRFRSRRLSLALLILMSVISNGLVFQEQPAPFALGMLNILIATASLLVSFFAFDVLTSIITTAAPGIFVFVVYLLSQPAASLNRGGYIAGVISLLMLALAIICWWRGREYREDEVRPRYARHLAERLGLQAEVSAAREAQARLMPAELPALRGVKLAAACLPARVVGGDFYDLFVFDRNKLGIFVAEGGGRGLGAALTIAYAKGFLMPRIDAGHSPAELIASLQMQLSPLLEQDEELAFAYAVVDTAQQTLAYARTGYYPQILTGQQPDATRPQASIRVPADEREFNLSSIESATPSATTQATTPAVTSATPLTSATPRTSANVVIREATIPLAEGDVIVFLTDGVVKSVRADRKLSMQEWVESVVSARGQKPDASLQQSLDRALGKRAKHIKKIGYEDDLTAVVVRVEGAGDAA